jgi:hypothetical protein
MRLKSRQRAAVQDAVLVYAKEQFARWEIRGEYKDPVALLRSFRSRLEASQAVDALLSDDRIPLDALARVLQQLVDFYDDPEIPVEPPPEWQRKRRRRLARRKELENEIPVLERALREAQRSQCWSLARGVERELGRRRHALEQLTTIQDYWERHAPPGRPLLPPAGAPKRTDVVLAERVEMVLARREPVLPHETPRWVEPPYLTPPERQRVIAALVSDFLRPATPEQIRWLLKDSRRREERKRARQASRAGPAPGRPPRSSA